MAVIIRDGIARMYGPEPEDCFYYLTLYNENYVMPPMPEGVGGRDRPRPLPLPRCAEGASDAPAAQILASGTMMQAALEAQQLLAEHHDVAADVWSATSYKLLREEALGVERWNRLHPNDAPRTPYVTEQLRETEGPVVAVTDFLKSVPDQVARFVPQPFIPLGTDGYGYSDTRGALRRHFEVDAAHSWWRRSTGWPSSATSRAKSSRTPSGSTRSTPKRPTPAYLTQSGSRSGTPDFADILRLACREATVAKAVTCARCRSSSGVRQGVVSLVVVSRPRSDRRPRRRSTSAREPPPSRNMPSSKPSFSSRASRNRRALPFLGTSSPALPEQRHRGISACRRAPGSSLHCAAPDYDPADRGHRGRKGRFP